MKLLTTFLAGAREGFVEFSNFPSACNSDQIQIDSALSNLSAQASDFRNTCAMLTGSFAYRLASLGLASSALRALPWLGHLATSALALSVEVSAFRASHILLSAEENSSSWGTDYLHFASLKIFGGLAHSCNPFLVHFFQSTGMVVGHQMAYVVGLAEKPMGSLAEQWILAEATNLQMQFAMGLSSFLTGAQLSVLENGMTRQAMLRRFSRAKPSSEGVEHSISLYSAPKHPNTANRRMLLGEIRLRMRPTDSSLESLEVLRRNIMRELGEDPQLHPEYNVWMDRLDQLNTHYIDVARKYQTLVAMFEPKGGAETWAEDRLELVLSGVEHTLERCDGFLAFRNEWKFNYTAREGESSGSADGIRLLPATSLEDLSRLYRKLELPDDLADRIFETSHVQTKADDPFVLNGLEGLEGLLANGGLDERAALIHFLNRVCARSHEDADSFQEILILGMNYQLGLLTRSSVVEVVMRSNQFHDTYPQAQGAFIEIFSKMHPQVSSDSTMMAHALHFARGKLEAGCKVKMVSHGHFGVAVMRVHEAEAEYYYGMSVINEEVSSVNLLTPFANRAVQAALSAIERQEERLPVRVYLALPYMTRRLSPAHLAAWGVDYLKQQPPQIYQMLVREDIERSDRILGDLGIVLMGQEREDRNRWINEARQFDLEQIEVAWYTRPMDLQGRVASREARGSDRMVNRSEVITLQSKSRDEVIQSLQESFLRGVVEAEDVSLLMDFLTEAGRHEEATEALRLGIQLFPKKRGLRSLWKSHFETDVASLMRSRPIGVDHPGLASLLSRYLGLEAQIQDLSSLFRLDHPNYHYADHKVDLVSGQLVFRADVLSERDVVAGSSGFKIHYHEESGRWLAQISELDVDWAYRGKGLSRAMMGTILEILHRLGVARLVFSPNQLGPYAWLRMGAEMPEVSLRIARLSLMNYVFQLRDLSVEIDFPHPVDSPEGNRQQFLENLDYLRREYPGFFKEFIEARLIQADYYFDLSSTSPSWKRFKEYIAQKQHQRDSIVQ